MLRKSFLQGLISLGVMICIQAQEQTTSVASSKNKLTNFVLNEIRGNLKGSDRDKLNNVDWSGTIQDIRCSSSVIDNFLQKMFPKKKLLITDFELVKDLEETWEQLSNAECYGNDKDRIKYEIRKLPYNSVVMELALRKEGVLAIDSFMSQLEANGQNISDYRPRNLKLNDKFTQCDYQRYHSHRYKKEVGWMFCLTKFSYDQFIKMINNK